MLGVIVLAAIGIWVFVSLLVLGMCRAANAGDRATEIAHRRSRVPEITRTLEADLVRQP